MRSNAQLTTRIEIKDKDGRKIGEKEVATYQGLLAKAHEEGLRSIRTELVQSPSPDNGQTAIVRATVRTSRGQFMAIGDATPANVNRRVAPHFLRMAETRAKARALRDAVNIGMVALEELGETLDEDESAPAPRSTGQAPAEYPPPPPAAGNGSPPTQGAMPTRTSSFQPMSDAQRRLIFRLASKRGIAPENAKLWLQAELGVPDLRALSRSAASTAIDQLQKAVDGQGNGQAVVS